MNLCLIEGIMSSPDNAVRVELRVQRLRSAPDVLARNCIHLPRAMKGFERKWRISTYECAAGNSKFTY
jgi:hypothetical protein